MTTQTLKEDVQWAKTLTDLRRDIEDTRGELTRDVDALTEKVRPSRILDRGVQRTRDRMSDMKDRVMGGAEDAAGSVRDGVSSAGETVTDTASDAAVAVKKKTQDEASARIARSGDA